MFIQNQCQVHYCRNIALSTFDENGNLTEDKNYCLDHIPDPGKVKDDVYKYIETHDKIVGLNCSGLIFSNNDLTGKQFFGCNFYHCTFNHVHSQDLMIHMSIFDFAVFNDCNLINSKILFSSFSGCTFAHTLFTSSNIIQSNFNGIKAFQSSFDDSDLFNSRFIMAKLVDTSFRNCNLKKAIFIQTEQSNVSFKMSNTREAIFEAKGSALSQGKAFSSPVMNSSLEDGAFE